MSTCASGTGSSAVHSLPRFLRLRTPNTLLMIMPRVVIQRPCAVARCSMHKCPLYIAPDEAVCVECVPLWLSHTCATLARVASRFRMFVLHRIKPCAPIYMCTYGCYLHAWRVCECIAAYFSDAHDTVSTWRHTRILCCSGWWDTRKHDSFTSPTHPLRRTTDRAHATHASTLITRAGSYPRTT